MLLYYDRADSSDMWDVHQQSNQKTTHKPPHSISHKNAWIMENLIGKKKDEKTKHGPHTQRGPLLFP